MYLDSDLDHIRRTYHFDPIVELLIPNIRMDAPKLATPVIARCADGTEYVLSRQQEFGSLLARSVPEDRIRLFEGYVTLDPRLKKAESAQNFAAAVRALTDDKVITVDPGFPYSRYLALCEHFTVDVEARPAPTSPRVNVFAVEAGDVLATFARLRARGPEAAARVIADVPHLDGLAAEFTTDVDTRFSALDKLAGRLGIGALLSSAPPNFSELTGSAWRAGVHALWDRASGTVFILARHDMFGVEGQPVGSYPDLAAAVDALVGQVALGVEEHWLDVTTALELRSGERRLVPASMPLGAWRDHRDAEDLPFQIIAARASRFCIEGALAFAQDRLDSHGGVRENEVYARYLDLVHEFRRRYEIPFTLEPFFVNLHAADRSLYPGPPTDFRITTNTGSVKLDAGLKVGVNGVVLGTSDMARSLVTTPQGREAYEFFLKVVREDIIGTLTVGRNCEQVHHDAVAAIMRNRARLIELDLLSDDVDFPAEYGKRNVGHLMGKQESFGIEFKRGHDIALPARSLGAAEIQWSYGRYSIGAEDMWYLGADKTYITSM
ncbi:hypothetical protein GCM10009555_093260 [Acrocarpospora macrocephala]|uniref:Xaa-Pro aminopeptidase n=1 Tax=Acrocarpospora macrocephala TaxID=150177 RepID=A0A5M3X750_9ACTN|nr:hypothetical protein [Acrocarpospora macrocephala]GES13998.1 hypothetical protein Amac_075950 [Acrocarpospora macrocephala]